VWPACHIPPGKLPVCFDDLQMHNSVQLRTVVERDEVSLLRSLEKKSRTITGNFTHNRYDP
jgi:hypothetical protein